MTTSTVTPEIAAFASAVRAALADLPADELDDLTDGLAADVAESLEEDLRRTLPDPVAYAAELRAAAGLPIRAKKPGAFAGLAQGWRDTRADLGIAIRRNPTLAGVVDFLVELRPAWWLLRAWVAFQIVAAFLGARSAWLPQDIVGWFVLAAFATISVQWGRTRWLPRSGLPWLIGAGNVLAVLLLLPVTAHAGGVVSQQGAYFANGPSGVAQPDLTGVYLNGVPVTNVFGYDANGKPLKDIQLFDQDGNPLATSVAGGNGCIDAGCAANGLWVPSILRNGVLAWNVFPMKIIKAADDGTGLKADPGAVPQDRLAPFAQVPPLVKPEAPSKTTP